MTRTDLQLKFNKETGLPVLQTGVEMNMYFTDDYIAWLENLALDKANGVEQSASTCNLQNVNQQRELLAAFQKDYNKRNFEDALIADIDIELFLAANSG